MTSVFRIAWYPMSSKSSASAFVAQNRQSLVFAKRVLQWRLWSSLQIGQTSPFATSKTSLENAGQRNFPLYFFKTPSISSFYSKCQCPNGEEKLLTLLGCKNGGMPRCRSDKGEISNDGPFGMMDPLVCQNPEKPLTAFDFIAAKTSGSKKCVCQSGYMPVCSKTYLPGMCPDGSLTNRTLTRLPFYLELCKS